MDPALDAREPTDDPWSDAPTRASTLTLPAGVEP